MESETPKQTFEDEYRSHLLAENVRTNEDGRRFAVRAYELLVDPMDQIERRGLIAAFGIPPDDRGPTDWVSGGRILRHAYAR